MAHKKKTSKADATRRALLEAALSVIAERGYSAATVDQIVEAAGVSKGVAYYHFTSKADIAECILIEGIDEVRASFQAIAGDAPTATAALVGMIESFAAFIFQNAAFGRFFVSELWRTGRPWTEAIHQHQEQLLAILRAQLERGQREGTVRSLIDPRFEAIALVGMVLTTTLYYIGEAEAAPEATEEIRQRFVTQVVDFVHHANGPSAVL